VSFVPTSMVVADVGTVGLVGGFEVVGFEDMITGR
jgi:hypothetical protein